MTLRVVEKLCTKKICVVFCPSPCVAKTCAARPFLAPVVGQMSAADPSRCLRGHEANASSGAQSEAPTRF